jgi:hypothetical protein
MIQEHEASAPVNILHNSCSYIYRYIRSEFLESKNSILKIDALAEDAVEVAADSWML